MSVDRVATVEERLDALEAWIADQRAVEAARKRNGLVDTTVALQLAVLLQAHTQASRLRDELREEARSSRREMRLLVGLVVAAAGTAWWHLRGQLADLEGRLTELSVRLTEVTTELELLRTSIPGP